MSHLRDCPVTDLAQTSGCKLHRRIVTARDRMMPTGEGGGGGQCGQQEGGGQEQRLEHGAFLSGRL